jgi:hypothetical protein
VPVGNSFCANHLGVKVSEFARDIELSNQTMLKSFTALGEVDGVQQPFFTPLLLSALWLSKIKWPGQELPDNVPWQVAEEELMTPEDYDVIINKGYKYFYNDFCTKRLDNLGKKLEPVLGFTPKAIQNFKAAGVVTLSPIVVCMPYEVFCGARSMSKFMRDLMRTPDKVQAAMDVAMTEIIEETRQTLKALQCAGAWVGGWRGASQFLSPKIWQRFVWPYFKKLVEVTVEEGSIPVLHLDSDWERDLEFFRELPKAKCIFSPDHSTSIFKAKEVLGDHMCIMGDVPASMFALGTPDDVYKYSTKLINEIGPSGYILSSGCDVPFNAKPENVAAMIAAATGK